MVTASAGSKVILGGEHAVVHGQPALALPFAAVGCTVEVCEAVAPGITIRSDQFPDPYVHGRNENPGLAFLGATMDLALEALDRRAATPETPPALALSVRSTIPVGCGLGSSAAVIVGLVRALFAHRGVPLDADELLTIAHAAEMGAHGLSSGIDPAVVAHGAPLRFQRGTPVRRLVAGAPFAFVVAATGTPASTRDVVLDLARQRDEDPARVEGVFATIGRVVGRMERAFSEGDELALGQAMAENHACLRELGVSCEALDGLTTAATAAGALGAKLTGAGRGGCILALATAGGRPRVEQALRAAGATWVAPLDLAPEPTVARA